MSLTKNIFNKAFLFPLFGVVAILALGVVLWQRFDDPASPTFVSDAALVQEYLGGVERIRTELVAGRQTASAQLVRDELLQLRVPEEVRDAHLQAIISLDAKKEQGDVAAEQVDMILTSLIATAEIVL